MPTKRFHVALMESDNDNLTKLARHLTDKTGLKVTRIQATVLAIRALVKKEKVS